VLAVIDAIRRGHSVRSNVGTIEFQATQRMGAVELPEVPEIRRMGVEQSNTSVLVGDLMVVKAYRKLMKGEHPELEIGRFLTEVADYRNTPTLLGAVLHVEEGGDTTALMIVQAFVRNQGDGWTFTIDQLVRYLDEVRLGAAPLEGVTEAVPEEMAFYLTLAGTLGQRTAELHRALAVESGNPAFEPEPITEDDVTRWIEAARTQAERAFGSLEQARARLTGDNQSEAEALLSRRQECLDLIGSLLVGGVTAFKTRYHGDYHLGQVLKAQNDWFVIDFEGEPAKSLDQRRAKHSPLRDVAGMVRSFNYAAWAAVKRIEDLQADAGSKVLGTALEWEQRAAKAFLTAYHDAIPGCPSYPADEAVAKRLLDLFTLEKALYEIAYEAANRPAWLGIPIKGVTGILDAHAASPQPGEV
jgi:maltose alpha-D-glucosyltransferase / alpha-amylase